MSADGNATSHAGNTSLDDDSFAWDKKDQGLLLSAYFYGYVFPNLIGGSLAEIYGGRRVIFTATFLSAIITSLSPLAANDNFKYMFAMRLLLGFLGGILYPASHQLIAKWAPANEKGKFVSTLLGGVFGTVITFPVVGYLAENYGWRYGFYVPAAFALLASLFWLYFVHDDPSVHPRISKPELELIEKSTGSLNASKRAWPPMSKVLTNLPFYALMLLHYGGTFGLFFWVTAAAKFMNEVLKFKLTEAGFLSSLPYLARLSFGYIFGCFGDFLRAKSYMTTTSIRKTFCIFSHVIPGLFLFGLSFVGCDPYICVLLMTLSLGFNGAATMTNLQNSQDLAPKFAGTVYGIINFVGTSSGIVSPNIVAYFTKERSTMEEWKWIFMIGGLVYILPALFFMIFGSGEVQKFNNADIDEKNEKSDVENSKK